MSKQLVQRTIIEVLFKEEIKNLKELFKKWFIGNNNERKTKNQLIVVDERHQLIPGRTREGYRYFLVVGDPSTGKKVALVKFEIQILDKGAL